MKGNETPQALTARQRRFVAAVLSARTIKEAAATVGVSLPTARRYLRLPAVRRELGQCQDAILGHVSGRLAGEMGEALDVLHAVMTDAAAPPPARVSAARAVLMSGLRLAELVTLADRVAELERKVNDGERS